MTVDAEVAVRDAFEVYADRQLAATATPHVASPVLRTAIGTPTRPRRSRRLQLVVVCAVLLLIGTAGWAVIRRAGTSTSPADASAVLELDGFRFEYPASLVRYRSDAVVYGPVGVAAYLTDQAVVAQCQESTPGNGMLAVRCGFPVESLEPDTTLVIFSEFSLHSGEMEASSFTTTVAGVPANIDRSRPTAFCPAGTATQTTATIRYRPTGGDLVVTGCFGRDAGSTETAFDTMLRTAQFTSLER